MDEKDEVKTWHPAVVMELIGLALCVGLGVLFFCLRGCLWDIAALALWGAVIVVFAVLLYRGERKLRQRKAD